MSEVSDDALALASALSTPFGDDFGSVAPPIFQSSLFTFDSFAAFEARMAGRSDSALYTRVQNPTVAAFESLMVKAECGARSADVTASADVTGAVGFASGMAAIASTLFALLKPGDKVACVTHVYPDAYRLFERLLRPFGIEIAYHDPVDFAQDPDLLAGVTLAYLESPNSLMLQTTDLAAVAEHARRHGTLTVIDNSWASPVFQRPLEWGIDIVIHSASKYLSGHSDTVAGVVIARQNLIDRIRDLTLPLLGAKLAPFEAWLLVRGLRTLEARLDRHRATADLFIARLRDLPFVQQVHSPGPEAVASLSGRSGLLSVEFDPSVDIPRFVDALRLFKLGVSWGGFESLVLPALVGLAQAGEENSMRRFGVPKNLVRVSLGLESAEDLWADFRSALTTGRA